MVAFSPITYDLMATTSGGGTDYDYDYDSSYSVKAYSTYSYDRIYDTDGVEHIDMTGNATGGWDILDSQVTVDPDSVEIGQTGSSKFGCGQCNVEIQKYPSNLTFSYAVDESWVPVNNGVIGITQVATVNRGLSSWDFTFYNRY